MEKPEYFLHEEYQNRLEKLKELKAENISCYPHKYSPSDLSSDLLNQYEGNELGSSADAENSKTPEVTIAGRLVLFRAMGKNAFGHIQDSLGRFQVMFNKIETKLSGYEFAEGKPTALKMIEKKLDLGDFIGVKGHLFRTQKGELTLFAKEVTLLCKTLLPLPDKHSGLTDKQTRYRKRWLDLIANPSVKDTFRIRSQILRFIRKYFEESNFIEVDTPVLQNIYGGAEARPFVTELNALDEQKMYLRISLEISLKKLLIGGYDRIFEIGKIFRNEGIDRTHNPEFTMLEAYAAYWDYNDLMVFLENLYEKLALMLFNTTKVPFGDQTIDVKAPWKRITMLNSIKEYAGIDVESKNDDELRDILGQCEGQDADTLPNKPRGLLIQSLFEELVEEKLIQPHHITDHPIETTPLCKPHRDPKWKEKGYVERFESFVLGSEICNAYSELNDPLLQRELFQKQHENKLSGDEEAHPLDEEFLEGICQGMPPNAGIGIGIDRLVMLFTNNLSIRDVLFFPLMKAKS